MRQVEVHPSDKERAEAGFPGSPMQRLIHNHLVTRLETLRTELEKASADDLKTKQGEIAEVRKFLGHIHRNDSKSVAEIYG